MAMSDSLFQYWRTREGLVLRLSELSDDHLLNCIRMVERNNPVFELWLDDAAQSEMLDCITSSLTDWEEVPIRKQKNVALPISVQMAFNQYKALRDEATKRHLL